MAGNKKGGQYERELCKKLSLWWSDGEHDDIFWRSSASGGRAKLRGRKGQRTHGHCGDICATHHSGDALTKFVTIEVKRGYATKSVAELLDKNRLTPYLTWEGWLQQAKESAVQAGSVSWILIVRHDRREEMVYMPARLFRLMENYGAISESEQLPIVSLRTTYRTRKCVKVVKSKSGKSRRQVFKIDGERSIRLIGVRLAAFLSALSPADVRKLAKHKWR